ncbi:hypothetical protein FVE85_2285 [Porphyridium purpureum]|uniref:30S ribosomal protein S6, chloroplastic n=1 Tax=Porphyridium purpureum TaxID=35688 RepID=A0A5J4YYS4_PORPP|nr:hypothetical protein FVE85_2285 [Porphyridium purpureum]|eukprot:POR8195..scf209_3
MPYYEWVVLADAGLARRELAGFVREMSMRVMEAGGVVTQLGHLASERGHGPRKLAYTITQNQVKHKFAYYLQLGVFLNPRRNMDVGRALRTDKRVLRCMTLRKPYEMAARPLPDGTEELQPASLNPDTLNYERDAFVMQYAQAHPDGSKFDAWEAAMQEHSERMRALEKGVASVAMPSFFSREVRKGSLGGKEILDALEPIIAMMGQAGSYPSDGKSDAGSGAVQDGSLRGLADALSEDIGAYPEEDEGREEDPSRDPDSDEPQPPS